MTAPTKPELQQQLTAALADRHRLQDHVENIDPEARALDGCVRALTSIPTVARSGTSVSWGSSNRPQPVPDRDGIRRVLLHVAARFGVDLVEHHTEPCDRDHLDDATDDDLLRRLRGWA